MPDEPAVEIEPLPSPVERAAILAALAATSLASENHAPGAWWEAGLRDEDERV